MDRTQACNFPPLKICPGCKSEKASALFYRSRSTKSGLTVYCKECSGKRHRKFVEMNKPAVRDYMNKRRRHDPQGYRNKERLWRIKNPDKVKQINRRRLLGAYGLTPETFDMKLLLQGGRCAICEKTPEESYSERGFVVDHDHATKQVRGILCHLCNIGIGGLRDDLAIVEKAAAYLKKYARVTETIHG